MASRNMAPVRTLQRGLSKVVGQFTGNGTGAPTGLLGVGIISAERTAAGRYLVTFNGRYQRLLHASAQVFSGVTGGTAPTVASARCVTARAPLQTTVGGRLVTQVEFFVTNNTGTEALTDLASTEILSFEACFVNSRTPPPRGN